MKQLFGIIVAAAWLASPAAAQSKLEQAYAKAEEQIKKGKPEDAVKTMTKAAEQAGAEGQVYLGRLLERTGGLDEAAAAYEKARRLSASEPPAARADILASVAHFTLRSGTGKDALALAKEAVQLQATPAALAAQARALVRTEDGPGGLQSADKAVAADPTSVIAHVARGEALIALGRNAEAETSLRKAIQLDPRSALAQSRLARALLSLDRAADAVAAGRKAMELDDKLGEGFALAGLAILAHNKNDWGEAIAQAQQGAFLDPKSPIVQQCVAKIFEANGQLEQAASAYRRALETDPGFAPARLGLIQAELNRGNREAALAEAKKAAADMPTSPEIQLLLGEMAVRSGDYAEALGFLEQASVGIPGNPDVWALLGRAYQFTRRPDDAAEAYGKAVQLAPQNTDLRSTYGLMLGLAGEHEAGLAELKKVVATPGYKDAAAHVNMGWIYRNMSRPQESIAAYKRALEIDPKQEQAALGLGWAYSYTKAYDSAIAAYNQAMRIDPKTAGDANIGIAWSYFFKREVPAAKAAMEKAAAAGRTDPRLKDAIAKLEQAIATGQLMAEEEMARLEEERRRESERAQRAEAANNAVRARNPATRARAARDLPSLMGGEAVPTLVWLMQTDKDWGVRIAATNALGALGGTARPALPNIKAMLNSPPYEAPINASQEEMDNMMKDGDLRRALRDALQRIER
jgi:tetratricopeptide (TPR) repeat protein